MSDRVLLENTETYLICHESSDCWSEVCSLHSRTDHHMRSMPQHWDESRYLMERICSHGIKHPDPDDYTLMNGLQEAATHGCDGCCQSP